MCYVWDQAVQQEFFRCRVRAFFTEIFFQISVVILNSTLHYQIFKFDIDIQILDWIFGSTVTARYSEGSFNIPKVRYSEGSFIRK